MRSVALRGVLAALAVGVVMSGCTQVPNTQLNPSPPMVQYTALRHPFREARLVVDHESEASRWQAAHQANWLDPITQQPQARWINGPGDLPSISGLVQQAREQHALPVIVAYHLPNRGCSPDGGVAADAPAYLEWTRSLIARLENTPTVVVLEPDAIAADCFDGTRAATLATATRLFSQAGHFVYLDAGHSGWRPTGEMAQRLLASGIAEAEGFSVNVSNRQSTADSYTWGRELSDLLGDRDFVIDTSRNAITPPVGEWCNVTPQGIGQPPTTKPRLPHLAALLWVKRPGESDRPCGGERDHGFSERQAHELLAHAWHDAEEPPSPRDR